MWLLWRDIKNLVTWLLERETSIFQIFVWKWNCFQEKQQIYNVNVGMRNVHLFHKYQFIEIRLASYK